jgi:hypothetical protein
MKCGLSDLSCRHAQKRIGVDFSRFGYFFPGWSGGRPLYLKPHQRVNTILIVGGTAPVSANKCRQTTAKRDGRVRTQRHRTRSGLIAHHSSPVATMFALAKTITVLAAPLGEALVWE